MNAPAAQSTLPAAGAAIDGGFYFGAIEMGGSRFGLVLAPAAHRHPEAPWNESYDTVTGALSYHDGLANTQAMAAAGSAIAKWALEQQIDGFADWYIPAIDELELVYRHLKPGTRANYCWARSGINQNSVPPGLPYTPTEPAQTALEAFRTGGPEAIAEEAHWSSTQYAGDGDFAWAQNFGHGTQIFWNKGSELPVLLVRRFLIG